MEKKQIMLFLGSFLGIVAFLSLAYMLTSKPQATVFPELAKVSQSDHVKWSPNGSIILMEFSDFQCPGCGALAGAIQSLQTDEQFVKEVKPHITFIYRHFPLDSIHPNARAAAQAAEAAGVQDAFFPMHDMLFARQSEWSKQDDPLPLFLEYAQALELDTKQFTADYHSQKVADAIQKDYQSGIEAQVRGTPSLFLNGSALRPPASAEALKATLINAIENTK